MQELSDYNKLIKLIKDKYYTFKNNVGNALNPFIIGIEGGTGVGKTYIATRLWDDLKLGGALMHCDNYKTANTNEEYVSCTDIIRAEIKALQSIHSTIILIEGVLLLQNLSDIVNPDLVIYIKRISDNNTSWADEEELSGEYKIDESSSNFRKQIRNYHQKFNPIEKEDIIYSNSWPGS